LAGLAAVAGEVAGVGQDGGGGAGSAGRAGVGQLADQVLDGAGLGGLAVTGVAPLQGAQGVEQFLAQGGGLALVAAGGAVGLGGRVVGAGGGGGQQTGERGRGEQQPSGHDFLQFDQRPAGWGRREDGQAGLAPS